LPKPTFDVEKLKSLLDGDLNEVIVDYYYRALSPEEQQQIQEMAMRELESESEPATWETLTEARRAEIEELSGQRPAAFGMPRRLMGKIFEIARNRLQALADHFVDSLYEPICVEFEYCKKLNSGVFERQEILLATAIIESLAFTLPVIHIAAYIIKSGMLDPLCRCR
jgi:hypothetical protein